MKKISDIMKRESRYIKRSILLFILGNVFFLAITGFTTVMGGMYIHKFFTEWYVQSWEKYIVIIGFGGFFLFVKILYVYFKKGEIPNGYKEISKASHPSLFQLIEDILKQLKITKQIRVFLTNENSSSIFVLSGIKNMVIKPERFLAIGNILIENMTNEELKAILIHELVHFRQDEIDEISRVTSIGLFADTFLSSRIEHSDATWLYMYLYYDFMDKLCRYIKKHYTQLADELEYEADKIAIRYIDSKIYASALLHLVKLSGKTEMPVSIMTRIERIGVYVKSGKNTKEAKKHAKIIIHLSHRKHFAPWVDHKYSLLLNGKDIGDGNLIKGFTIEKDVLPDVYTLEIYSYISKFDSKPYTFEVDASCIYQIELDYKCNFRKMKYIVFCQEVRVISNNEYRNDKY